MCCAAHPPPHRRRRTPRHIPNPLLAAAEPVPVSPAAPRRRTRRDPAPRGTRELLPWGLRGAPGTPKRCPPLGSRCCGARWASKREKGGLARYPPARYCTFGDNLHPPIPSHPSTHTPLNKESFKPPPFMAACGNQCDKTGF